VPAAQLDYAEALIRTGAAPEARRQLERLSTDSAADPASMPRTLLLLAQAREAAGDRSAALETYGRLRQDYPSVVQGSDAAQLGQGRLLLAEGKWDEARPLYERALGNADPAVAAAAAFELGEGLRARQQHQDAVEFYMTAAYLGADTPAGRRALLAAGQSFAALRQRDAAEIVYKKLAASKNVEPDLAEAARRELKALGAN
jgi:tetratricopeptide (TPR) repeat protein